MPRLIFSSSSRARSRKKSFPACSKKSVVSVLLTWHSLRADRSLLRFMFSDPEYEVCFGDTEDRSDP
jgi:hypothetical protein